MYIIGSIAAMVFGVVGWHFIGVPIRDRFRAEESAASLADRFRRNTRVDDSYS